MKNLRPLTICALAMVAMIAPGISASTPSAASQDASAEEVMMLRLRDGSIRWGSISEHDPDGIRYSLLSHGGMVRLPWQMIDPVQEQELRTRFGYVDVSSEELLIDVSRIVLKGGGEVLGVITSGMEGGNLYNVKVDGNLQAIPKLRVARIQSGVRVPALDIYSREEIYMKLISEANLEDLESIWELGNNCERILDFAHAVEHFQIVIAIDPDFRREAITAKLAAAIRKAAQQEQIDYLREIDQLRKKKYFNRALALADAFGDTFRDSPLYAEVNKKKVQVQVARDKALTADVRNEWLRWMGRFARQAAIDKSYEECLDYAAEGLGEDIINKVTEVLIERGYVDMESEQVRQFWEKRKRSRWATASYSYGTWLLGKEDAQKGMNEDKDKDQSQLSNTQKQRASTAKKIERYLKSQQMARKARSRTDDAENYEAFWAIFSVNSRSKWITAMYVENGGDFEINPKPRLIPCADCGGAGAREVIYTGGGGDGNDAGSQLVACPMCHQVQVIRQIRYR